MPQLLPPQKWHKATQSHDLCPLGFGFLMVHRPRQYRPIKRVFDPFYEKIALLMPNQNSPLLPWPNVLVLIALTFMFGAMPLGMIYLDPLDNVAIPLISIADNIIAESYSLAVCAFLLWLPLPFLLVVARLNPHQKLPTHKDERHLGNWRWTLHKVTFFAIMTCLFGGLLLCITGNILQPKVIEARGYDLCWRVKTGNRSHVQGYVRTGLACPDKPSRASSNNQRG